MNKSVYQCLIPLWDLSFIFWFAVAFIYGNSLLVTLALALFMGLSVAVLLLKGKFKIPAIAVFYAFFIFICLLNVRLGYSMRPTDSMAMVSTMLKGLLFMCVTCYYAAMRGTGKFLDIFVNSTLLGSVAIYVLNLLATGSLIIREQGAFNANTFAVASAFAVCYIIFKDGHRTLIGGAKIAWFLLFCLAAGTRKAIVAIIVILAVYMILKSPKKLLLNMVYVGVFVAATYFLLTKIPFVYESIGYRFVSLLKMLEGGSGDSSAESRQMYIDLALKYFENRPMWGHGINCFKLLDGANETYSHNNFTELLFGVGIIGAVSYYLMHLWVLLAAIVNYLKHKSQNALISIAFIIGVVVTDIAWVAYYERTIVIFVILCYVLLNEERNDGEKNTETSKESI